MWSVKRCNSNFTDPSCILAIQELRSRVLQDKSICKYNEDDVHRIRNEDWWLNVFLHSNSYDVDISFAIILECLKWRASAQIERISLLFMRPLFDRQLIYVHGKDQNDRPILWIKCNQYQKGDEGFEQLFIFWLERHYMESRGSQMKLFLDMTGTTLKHMSFDIFKFIIHASKYYYPNAIESILVFDSPPILNASWKVIKSWVEQQPNFFTFVTKESAPYYVSREYLQPHQGGTDTFNFTMDELAKCLPPPPPPKPKVQVMHSIDDNANEKDPFDFPNKRNVKFDDEEDAGRRTPLTMSRRSSRGPGKRIAIPTALKPMVERRANSSTMDWKTTSFVSITPREEIVLDKIDGESDFLDVVLVKNISNRNIIFKFKTTSPEKFRVRPSAGVILPGSTETIRVYLQNEYRHSCGKEKFLLQAVETDGSEIENFSETYKSSPHDKKIEQKFRCKLSENYVIDSPQERRSSYLTNQETNVQTIALQNQIETLNKNQLLLMIILAFLFVLQIMFIFSEKSNNRFLTDTLEKLTKDLIEPKQNVEL